MGSVMPAGAIRPWIFPDRKSDRINGGRAAPGATVTLRRMFCRLGPVHTAYTRWAGPGLRGDCIAPGGLNPKNPKEDPPIAKMGPVTATRDSKRSRFKPHFIGTF